LKYFKDGSSSNEAITLHTRYLRVGPGGRVDVLSG
jgi:hypothetical protein